MLSKRLWDFTALDVLERCEEEWVQRFLRNRESPHPKLEALFGQAVHAGVAALYDGKVVEDAVRHATWRWDQTTEAAFASPYFVNKKPYLAGTYVEAIVRMYVELRGPFTCVMNERYLEWPEAGFCGVVDRVVEHAGALVVRDLKTTGLYVGEAWGQQWAQSAQAAGYLDLAEVTLNGGVLPVPILRAPGGDASLTDGHVGAPSSAPRRVTAFWADAVHVDRRGYPKQEDFHEFGPFSYSDALRGELRTTRAQAIFRARELEQWPQLAQKRTHACFRFNSLCPLFRYCVADPDDREARYEMALASGELVSRVWDPAHRDDAA